MLTKKFGKWMVVASALMMLLPASADVRVSNLFNNDMVFQRNMPLKIWGSATPGEKVNVQLGVDKGSATADELGNWMVTLPPLKEGKDLKLTIAGKNTLTFTDIVMGEVWLCSGQSNMDLVLWESQGGREATPKADYPDIRVIHQPRRLSGVPLRNAEEGWRICSPKTAGSFSAVAFHFAHELQLKLNVPVGLIVAPVGGTAIEPWLAPAGYGLDASLKNEVGTLAQANAVFAKGYSAALDQMKIFLPKAKAALAEGKPLPPIPEYHHPLDGSDMSGLYRGMIAPFVPFTIRGVVWYQGESNMGAGMKYFDRMKALIGGWRAEWKQSDLPFYYVQLASYIYDKNKPTELPEMWEAQTAALAIPNTGMVVITDVSTPNNIHPPNKQPVGYRLALLALAKTYGQKNLVYSGPLYKSMKVEGSKIQIQFDHCGGGLVSRDGKPLDWFTISGDGTHFVPAKADVVGQTVVVSSDTIDKPVAVRFAWDQTAQPNLMNKEGLPASSFRTNNLKK
jgi:sialate O-acetylesterase